MRDNRIGGLRSVVRCGSAIVLWGVAGTCLQSCKPKPPLTTTQPAAPAIGYAEVAAAHNARVAQLQTIYGQGVLEVTWFDADGHRHKDQGDLELWINLPRKTALRVDAVGEVLLWIGSDDDRYWVFDHLGKQKVLRTGRHEDEVLDDEGRAFAVKPLAMVDLMGLTPLPESPAVQPTVQFDPKRDAWVVQAEGGGGLMRIFFDRTSMLPRHIESLDAHGVVRVQSDLSRYDSVKRKGMSPAAYPKLAELVDISEVRPEVKDVGQVKVAVNEYTDGVIDDQPFDRVFDLSRLMGSFSPDRVEGDLSPPK